MVQSGEMCDEKRESGWRLVNIENRRTSESQQRTLQLRVENATVDH